MSTQWRVGFYGETGLDYSVIPVVMKLCGIEDDLHIQVFNDLRILEDEAIRTKQKDAK